MGLRPTDTRCPICNEIFQQPHRVQGGGSRRIYCSHRCAALNWSRHHPLRRKASVIKYDNVPENKERKRETARLRKLREYGLTGDDYDQIVRRQHNRCGGCNKSFSSSRRPNIDHDHLTGRVRGLLCAKCNWTIGSAEDDRARLYQLAAYLELDKSRPVIFLAGSLRNPKMVEVGNAIRSLGIECVDNWIAAGKIADDSWRDYSIARGKTFREALESREANHVYYFDRAYLNLCDGAVLVYPAGKSAHIELGYVAGQGKPSFILFEDHPKRYDVMLQLANVGVFMDENDLLDALSRAFAP